MALTITRIPQPYRSGFAKIKKLSPAETTALSLALEKVPPAGGLKGMVSAISGEVSALKKEDIEDIVRTLYSLYAFRASSEAPLSDFVSDLTTAMRASGQDSLALSDEEANEFKDKLSKLLGLHTPAIVSKVEQLKTDYTNIFYDAKILTDIRPIFAEPAERPVGAAIIHILKVAYHEGGEHKEFYVALDAEDLQKISKVVQRADAKATSLKALLKSATVPDLS